jgi:hypothetical protein
MKNFKYGDISGDDAMTILLEETLHTKPTLTGGVYDEYREELRAEIAAIVADGGAVSVPNE